MIHSSLESPQGAGEGRTAWGGGTAGRRGREGGVQGAVALRGVGSGRARGVGGGNSRRGVLAEVKGGREGGREGGSAAKALRG